MKSEKKSIKNTSVPIFRSAFGDVLSARQVFLTSGNELRIRLKRLAEGNKTVSDELEFANDRHEIQSLLEHMQTDAEVTKLRRVKQLNLDKGPCTLRMH